MSKLESYLISIENPAKAKDLAWFFKTGKGQYGEGDQFLGITVPLTRAAVKKYWQETNLADVPLLLNSKYHEVRLAALLVLVKRYQNGSEEEKSKIFNLYLKSTSRINNWDLVDLSAHKIVGDYLIDRSRQVLYKLSKSNSLWERRISIIATFAFIDKDDLSDSLKLAEILLLDKEDLIHKAVGWVLREVGKKDIGKLRNFLNQHTPIMPRTTLRYAIEKIEEAERQSYLKMPRV